MCQTILSRVEAEFKVAEKAAKAAKKKLNAIEKIEKIIDEQCKDATKATEKKVCYFITPIKRKVSPLMSNYAPVDRICKKLKKEAPDMCAVREAVKIEKGVTDYQKLKIKDLKKILADRGTKCTNCLEKSEFVKRCQETEDLERDEL